MSKKVNTSKKGQKISKKASAKNTDANTRAKAPRLSLKKLSDQLSLVNSVKDAEVKNLQISLAEVKRRIGQLETKCDTDVRNMVNDIRDTRLKVYKISERVDENKATSEAAIMASAKEDDKRHGIIYYILAFLSVSGLALAASVFFTGCKTTSYDSCTAFVSHANNELKECRYHKYVMDHNDVCGPLINADIECRDFYKCLEDSIFCTEYGIVIRTENCGRCYPA